MAANRWACHMDKQLQVSGGVNGLQHFISHGNTQMWKDSNWRLWRHLTISMDLGSDGVAAMHALMYGLLICLWLMPDPSHGCNRDVDLTICHLGLKPFWLPMMVCWHLLFGPDKDHYRFHQLKESHQWIFQKKCKGPRDNVMFMHDLHNIIEDLKKLGHTFDHSGDIAHQAWDICKERDFGEKVRQRCNLNSFCGSISKAAEQLAPWHIHKWERTTLCLELDMMSKKALKDVFVVFACVCV